MFEYDKEINEKPGIIIPQTQSKKTVFHGSTKSNNVSLAAEYTKVQEIIKNSVDTLNKVLSSGSSFDNRNKIGGQFQTPKSREMRAISDYSSAKKSPETKKVKYRNNLVPSTNRIKDIQEKYTKKQTILLKQKSLVNNFTSSSFASQKSSNKNQMPKIAGCWSKNTKENLLAVYRGWKTRKIMKTKDYINRVKEIKNYLAIIGITKTNSDIQIFKNACKLKKQNLIDLFNPLQSKTIPANSNNSKSKQIQSNAKYLIYIVYILYSIKKINNIKQDKKFRNYEHFISKKVLNKYNSI